MGAVDHQGRDAGREHRNLRFISTQLDYEVLTYYPCFDYARLIKERTAEITCPVAERSRPRYLYVLAIPPPTETTSLLLDRQASPLIVAPEFRYMMPQDLTYYRTPEAVALSGYTTVGLSWSPDDPGAPGLADVFESEKLLDDGLEPKHDRQAERRRATNEALAP